MWSLNFIVINKTLGGDYLKCFYFCKYVILNSECIINILLNEFSSQLLKNRISDIIKDLFSTFA